MQSKLANGFLIKDKRGLTAVAIVSRQVGIGIERPVGSTAVGKKSAKRNELGNPNDTLETLSCLIKSKERPQVVTNDYRMLLCKVTVKLGHSFHFSFLYKSRCSSTARMSAFQAEDTGPIPVTGSIVSGVDPGSSA